MRMDTIEARFLLVSVAESEITVSGYETHKEAWEAMCNELEKKCDIPLTKYFGVDEIETGKDYEADDGKLQYNEARYNDGPNHCNYDWKIVEIQQKEKQDKPFAVIIVYSFDPTMTVVRKDTYEEACQYLFDMYSEELALAVETHPDGYVTDNFIANDCSYAKIVDSYGSDTTEWRVVIPCE